MSESTLTEIETVLHERKQASVEASYVASLYAKGIDGILKKIGEEATETVIAAKQGDREQIIYEMADLWFHSMVMLAHCNIPVAEVIEELARRQGLSGHEEKAQRS